MNLFHGTTADALSSILTHGLLTEEGGANWHVSGDNVYFWSPKHLIESGETEEDGAEDKAKNNAFESALFGVPFSSDCRVVLLEIDPEGLVLHEDDSCGDVMIMAGAVYSMEDVPASAIRRVWLSEDLSLLKGYLMQWHLNRTHSARELSDIEKRIAKAMVCVEIYPEDIEEIAALCKISIDEARALV